ncbi:ATPase [Lentzea pudingi]|uniref:ATPase n=1 Tax=Lentzea pudingi TaxID=1789439 RepID=A0ABQ2HYC6_9PSEU|nr:ATP-binding protein [Lentzea pudingi]GGM92970.1 ATPase [Lentzea pudingi]
MLPNDQPGDEPGLLSQELDLDRPRPSIAAVRDWTRDGLSGLDEDVLEDVVLVINELVSNAFDHGLPPRRIRLHRSSDLRLVRVEVDDASLDTPVVGASRLNADRGRGLIIVDRLVKGWGVVDQPAGKTVWAEVDAVLPVGRDEPSRHDHPTLTARSVS